MEINESGYNQMLFWYLGTVQHSLNAVMRVWPIMDCILMTLNVDDDDDDEYKY